MTTEVKAAEAAAVRPLSKRQAQVLAAGGWWKALQPRTHENGAVSAGDRATLAKLRRSSNPFELAVEPATAALFRALKFGEARARDIDLMRAAVLAGVLSHIRTHAEKSSLARDMAGPKERPVVSAIRMKRFMSAREPEDVLRQFQRALAMLGDKANVYDVAETVLAWLDDTPAGDRARTRFAFKYHGTILEDADALDSDTTVTTTAPETKA